MVNYDNLYDATKVEVLENTEELTGKELKKLETYQKNKPVFDAIFNALTEAVSDTVYYSPDDFMPVLMEILKPITTDKKIVEKIADGLSVMDKNAKIQRDRKGNVIYDKASKDTEFVNIQEDIEDYMAREVWPYVPDAKAFFEEKLGVKKPVIKTGAEISFTKYFYKYQQPESSEVLAEKFIQLDKQVTRLVSELFSTEV